MAKRCNMPKYIALIPCAGSGSRFKSELPKQYHKIAGKTVLDWTILAFSKVELISEIVIIANKEDNVLKNAPHTAIEIASSDWQHTYSREKAAFPMPAFAHKKFWPSVARVNNTHGDRNLICACLPIEAYAQSAQ